MSQLEILGACVGITAAIQLAGFVVAFTLRTETFYDILGGINFLVLGAYSASAVQQHTGRAWSDDARKMSCTAVFSCSRLWLLVFLAWRAHERGGDSRFDDVKNKFGMFLLYWTVQGFWVLSISLPVIFVNSSTSDTDFSTLDWAMIACFGFGVLWEIASDVQKAVWVKSGRPGTFCRVGVWKFSRHPNYFGEMLQWWCAWGFAYGSGTGIDDVLWWCCIFSPVFTMHILLNTSGTGVAHANGKNLKRYYDQCPEEYEAYRKRTSILIPFLGYEHVPLPLKRTIFMDFKRYQYRPGLKGGGSSMDDPKRE